MRDVTLTLSLSSIALTIKYNLLIYMSKFVDSRVSKAVRSLKEEEKEHVMLTTVPSQDSMRKTTNSLQFNAIKGIH